MKFFNWLFGLRDVDTAMTASVEAAKRQYEIEANKASIDHAAALERRRRGATLPAINPVQRAATLPARNPKHEVAPLQAQQQPDSSMLALGLGVALVVASQQDSSPAPSYDGYSSFDSGGNFSTGSDF